MPEFRSRFDDLLDTYITTVAQKADNALQVQRTLLAKAGRDAIELAVAFRVVDTIAAAAASALQQAPQNIASPVLRKLLEAGKPPMTASP